MTSGNFSLIPIDSIKFDRATRQRRELEDIEELAESIQTNGLINPILVTRDHKLVAGERRLTACLSLGMLEVPVHYTDELDELQLHILELEENVRRADLSWQDEVRAVEKYHKAKMQSDPDWSQGKTAASLGFEDTKISRTLLVARTMDEGVEEVLEAPKFSTAHNFAQRREERKRTVAKRSLIDELGGKLTTPDGSPVDIDLGTSEPAEENLPGIPDAPTLSARRADIIQADFTVWSQDVQSEPFNFLHVDFPYGVSAGDRGGQSARGSFGSYSDRPETYFELLETFCKNLDNFAAPSCHLMFWFSMDYYAETLITLRDAGWAVNPFPLIWFKSDNTGILPDKDRGPRRVYETALMASRGDRKIVRAVGNCVGATTPSKDEKIHMSQKSRPMLEHFFRMFVDEYTRMLDPTCGSGVAVSVAEGLGADFSLGLEMNPDFVTDARHKLDL